jgi:hypothetical protein
MRILGAVWLAAALVACEHTAPFTPAAYTPTGPLGPGPSVRLTYNPGADLAPVWLPGGASILYIAERVDRLDRDQCLATMPSAGGSIARYVCHTSAPDDSVNAFERPALAVDGRIAYVRASAHRLPVRPVPPDAQALVVATLADPNDATVLRPLAYTAPSGRIHQGIANVGWLSPNRLVYLGQRVTYPQACSSCPPDTVRTGIEIMTLDMGGATPVLTTVPGTDSASSVIVGGTGDTIYFTRNGDTRVYRYAFSSSQTDTVHDFGAAGIARDLGLANGRLVAVVGGDVSYTVDPVLGAEQVDHGGALYFVTIASGGESAIGDGTSRFRRPALSPDGTLVVTEVWANGSPDLWLLGVP